MAPPFTSDLTHHDEDSISLRGHDLTAEVMGELDFGSSIYLLITGEMPSESHARMTNAILPALMDHGMTSQAIATRMTLLAAPESTQGAVASGLLGAGSRFLGAMEACASDLQAVVDEAGQYRDADDVVRQYQERGDNFPGIGHPIHTSGDPRADRLFELAAEEGVAGEHVEALHAIRDGFTASIGRELPINVTGAIAAVTADMGLSPRVAKGFALISRTPGLVAHVTEEQDDPIAHDMWQLIEEHTEYTAEE
jgi:citrate synthase